MKKTNLLSLFSIMRPYQWAKNLFIFLPLFFGDLLLDPEALRLGFVAFASFCFIASSIYCFNDLLDVEEDRLHHTKCNRPFARGDVSRAQGYVLMGLLAIIAITIATLWGGENRWYLVGILSFYFVLNLLYSWKLKHFAIVDVIIIAIGFVLRLIAGGVTCNIVLSHWIVIMTFLLALFLAFAKRRDDVLIYDTTGIKARENITRYNLTFLNSVLSILSAITIVSYIMYTVSEEVVARIGSQYLYLTSVFVIAGILRYLQLTLVDEQSGSPTKILLTDRFIQISIIGWILSFVFLIYI